MYKASPSVNCRGAGASPARRGSEQPISIRKPMSSGNESRIYPPVLFILRRCDGRLRDNVAEIVKFGAHSSEYIVHRDNAHRFVDPVDDRHAPDVVNAHEVREMLEVAVDLYSDGTTAHDQIGRAHV